MVETPMKKTLQISIALLLVAAALLAYLLVSGQKPQPPPGPADRDWKPTRVVPEGLQLQKLTMVRPDLTVVFELNQDGAWDITQPLPTIPEPQFTKMLLEDLLELKREKIVELLATDFAPYQLDHPAASFTLDFGTQHPEITVHVGKINYNQDHLFAKTGDDPTVFLIPSSFRVYLESPFDAFRTKTLMYHQPMDLISFEIKVEDPELKASNPLIFEPTLAVQETKDQPVWVITKPVHETAEFSLIRGFFQRIHFTSSEHVVDITEENRERLGFDHPRLRVIYHCRDGSEEQTLVGAQAEPGLFFARSSLRPEAVVISQDFVNFLASASFRSNLTLDPSRGLNLEKMTVEFPRQPEDNFTLLNDAPTRFHFVDEPGRIVLMSKIFYLLKPFRNPNAIIIKHFEPFDLKEQGLDPPALHLVLQENGAVVLDVSVGSAIVIGENQVTYFVDNLRHLNLALQADILATVPLSRQDLTATPEEINRADKTEARRLKEKDKEKTKEDPP
jgi:hypothetical protein